MDADEAPVIGAALAVIGILIGAAELIERRNRRRARRTLWTREWLRRREGGLGLLNMVQRELAEEDTDAYRNFMRMTEDQFNEILNLVRRDICRQDTVMREAISPEKR
jgi:hypothetical protein